MAAGGCAGSTLKKTVTASSLFDSVIPNSTSESGGPRHREPPVSGWSPFSRAPRDEALSRIEFSGGCTALSTPLDRREVRCSWDAQ
jgi:hypothetical protein